MGDVTKCVLSKLGGKPKLYTGLGLCSAVVTVRSTSRKVYKSLQSSVNNLLLTKNLSYCISFWFFLPASESPSQFVQYIFPKVKYSKKYQYNIITTQKAICFRIMQPNLSNRAHKALVLSKVVRICLRRGPLPLSPKRANLISTFGGSTAKMGTWDVHFLRIKIYDQTRIGTREHWFRTTDH